LFFPELQQPYYGLDRLFVEVSRLHTVRHTSLSQRALDEGSTRPSDLYLTTHNIYKRQLFTTPAEFEPAISKSERQQTHAFDREATGIGVKTLVQPYVLVVYFNTRQESLEVSGM